MLLRYLNFKSNEKKLMHYISTRGGISPIPFKDAVMMGLATDGGLLLPEVLPAVAPETLKNWQSSSFQKLAAEIFRLFISDIENDRLDELINLSYFLSNFNTCFSIKAYKLSLRSNCTY